MDAACREFESRLAKLELAAADVRSSLDNALTMRAAQVVQVEGIDLVLRHAYPDIDPAGVHVVRAWAGKYGRRGALKEFIEQTVQDAQSGGVRASAIRAAVIVRFGLKLETKRDRETFRACVRVQLTRSCAQGLIHCRPGGSRGALECVWNQGPSGAQLLALAASAGGHDDNSDSYAVGAEMGRQRVGCSDG